MIGSNDGVVPSETETKDVTLEVFERNMNQIVRLLVDPSSPYAVAHDTHPLSIILITPPMYNEEMRGGQNTTVMNERNIKYCEAVLRVGQAWQKKQDGERWKIGMVDLYRALEEARKSGDSRRFYTSAHPHLDCLLGMVG